MKKRILCLTLGLMLTISQAVPAGAASRKDQLKQDKAAAQSQLAAQESKINNLEDQKQTLSAEIDQLDSDLVNIMVEIEILDGELSDKEAQIEQTKADLAVAEENKQKQYEAMKKRIQYLYEKGGDDAWAQMLFQASDFTSLLNQAEYVQQMYDSDRNSLEEFKETVQQVKDLGDQLDSEKAELEEMNQEYQNRQASMQTQLQEKKATSSDYDAQIAQAQSQAAQYTELIRQQNAEIQKIEEEEKKAAEEAARKAEEEAADEKESERNTQRIPDDIVRLMEEMESENEDSEDEIYEEEFEDGPGMDEDFIEGIEDELDGLDMNGSSFEEGDFDEGDFEEEDLEGEDFDEADFEEEDLEGEDFEEGDFEEEDFDEEDFDEADFEEEDLDEEELEEADFDEDDDEDDFEDIDDEETDFDEGDFEEDMDEEDFDEEEIDDDEELDFGEDLEGEDFDEADFEEEDLDEGDFDEGDFEEEDFDEEEIEDEDDTEELEIEEPSEEEIQARIKKSKGGVPFDTGFVVTGRYDLSATSEIGLKAGLTEEQKKLFSYFVPVRGMSEQIVEVLDNDRRAQREGTSKTGNLLVIGRKGSGKTVLAVDIVKAIQKQRNLKQGKVAIVTGESLNKKELTNIIQKLRGGAIIIEHAGKLNSRTVKELNYLMEKKTGELLFVLEDQRKPLERLMTANPEFKKKFSSKLELPVFINDELVTFGQTYAKENGYKLDEMGILALYSRIDVMQREDHAVSVAEVKEIMDEAIAHSQKANVKHLARRVFGKGTDDSDRIILKEEDFKI